MNEQDTVLARVAALKAMPTAELRKQWQALFDTPPPPYNRRFLESRLAYRIQELAYGGLKPETVRRLEQLGEQLDGGNIAVRRRGVEELLPLLPQLWRRHAPESRDLRQDSVLFCHAVLRLGASA